LNSTLVPPTFGFFVNYPDFRLPNVRLDAIIILMSRKEICMIQLENTVGRRLLVSSRDSKGDNQIHPGDIDKIAHDFRSSLNIITGFTELMLDEVTGKINAEQRYALNDILNNGKRLLALVDDVVKKSKTESDNKK
jgi:signal transduction histidine kinase